MLSEAAPQNDLIVFLDANIVLEGNPLGELPWAELAPYGLIRVLIVPTAMEEIDAKKRDGRLGPHARAFNRLIAPSVTNGKPVVLCTTGPRVELQMATCSRIPWNDYDELDPQDGDSRIVAEALHVRNVVSSNRLLVSHDIKPLAYARGRNLAVHQVSDDWLRQLEPGPKDKEIQRLKQQLAELRKDEPSFEISIEIPDASPVQIYKVAQLDPEQSDALIATITQQNPKMANGCKDPYGLNVGALGRRDSSYDGAYSSYISKQVPAFVADYSSKLELIFNQRLLNVRVVNLGPIRADHLVVTVSTNQGWLNERVVFVSPTGPAAPVPKPDYLGHLNLHGNIMQGLVRARVGRHEFETILPARRSRAMEDSCEDFRSGQEYCFEGILLPSTDAEPLELTVTLTAKNLRGEQSKTISLQKQIIPVVAGELVGLASLHLKHDFPTQAELDRLFTAEQFDAIEIDGRDDS